MHSTTRGWLNGFIGVAIFAGSLPATRIAVTAFEPTFLTCARATLAALLAGLCLRVLRQPRPGRIDLASLAITALGVVVGFPLLTALALQHVTSAHAIVFIGLLPLCTAGFAVLRGGERPRPPFWLFSGLGAGIVASYAGMTGGEGSTPGDLLMIAAVVACGLGYAEGARLSRRLGGWQVISWALLLALPFMLALAVVTLPAASAFAQASPAAWLSFAYVSVFSMLIGFVFWYRGLVLGGIAAVGQLQLVQPFLGLGLAALLLGEQVSWTMLGVTVAAVLCVAGAKRYGR